MRRVVGLGADVEADDEPVSASAAHTGSHRSWFQSSSVGRRDRTGTRRGSRCRRRVRSRRPRSRRRAAGSSRCRRSGASTAGTRCAQSLIARHPAASRSGSWIDAHPDPDRRVHELRPDAFVRRGRRGAAACRSRPARARTTVWPSASTIMRPRGNRAAERLAVDVDRLHTPSSSTTLRGMRSASAAGSADSNRSAGSTRCESPELAQILSMIIPSPGRPARRPDGSEIVASTSRRSRARTRSRPASPILSHRARIDDVHEHPGARALRAVELHDPTRRGRWSASRDAGDGARPCSCTRCRCPGSSTHSTSQLSGRRSKTGTAGAGTCRSSCSEARRGGPLAASQKG